jgi:hypothetical protein
VARIVRRWPARCVPSAFSLSAAAAPFGAAYDLHLVVFAPPLVVSAPPLVVSSPKDPDHLFLGLSPPSPFPPSRPGALVFTLVSSRHITSDLASPPPRIESAPPHLTTRPVWTLSLEGRGCGHHQIQAEAGAETAPVGFQSPFSPPVSDSPSHLLLIPCFGPPYQTLW